MFGKMLMYGAGSGAVGAATGAMASGAGALLGNLAQTDSSERGSVLNAMSEGATRGALMGALHGGLRGYLYRNTDPTLAGGDLIVKRLGHNTEDLHPELRALREARSPVEHALSHVDTAMSALRPVVNIGMGAHYGYSGGAADEEKSRKQYEEVLARRHGIPVELAKSASPRFMSHAPRPF